MKKRAAGYARVSTKEQASGGGTSFDTQSEATKFYLTCIKRLPILPVKLTSTCGCPCLSPAGTTQL